MPSPIFFWIDDQPISVEQALNYLQASGRLQLFLQKILQQHAIALRLEELQTNSALNLTPDTVEQILKDFRERKQLQDDKNFLAWLEEFNIRYEDLQQQLIEEWILQQLKEITVDDETLKTYLTANGFNLDRFMLSWIGVRDKDLAEEIFDQIEEGKETFDQFARESALSDVENDVGWMQSFRRGELHEELKEAIKDEEPGSITKPIQMGDRWYVVRFEQLRKASFGELKEQLRSEQFEQQLVEEAEAMTVKLEVTRWSQLQTSTR
jgi:parvulin-like peptidyl-prolyl isomerase